MASSSGAKTCSKCDVPNSCPSCSPNEYTASRLDLWHTSYKTLTAKEGSENPVDWGEQYDIDPQDVLALALFLSGEMS